MDFVFDQKAEGRVIKNLTVVDDATFDAVRLRGQAKVDQLLTITAYNLAQPRTLATLRLALGEGNQNHGNSQKMGLAILGSAMS